MCQASLTAHKILQNKIKKCLIYFCFVKSLVVMLSNQSLNQKNLHSNGDSVVKLCIEGYLTLTMNLFLFFNSYELPAEQSL